MNKILVRIVALVAVVALVVVLLVLATGGPTKTRFALVPKSIGHPYWEGVREGMQQAAARLGVDAVFQGPAEASIEEQIKVIEGLIAGGYDGIGISPNDPDAVKEVIKRAMAKGIAVVTFDSDSPASERLLYIGTDNREGGRVGAKAMIQILGAKPAGQSGEKLLVQVIGGKPGAWNLKERMDGFAEGVRGTHIVLADVLYNDENPDTALQVAESTINARPELRAFFCSNAFGGPGAALAIKGAIQRGKIKPGQVRVVAFDTTEDILDFIDEGVIDCTLAQNTRQMGRISIEKLVEFTQQYRAQKAFQRPGKGTDVIDTGVSVVWPKDVPKYRAKPAGAKRPQTQPATAPK
jgi:ribose transport system substrate-binding protein